MFSNYNNSINSKENNKNNKDDKDQEKKRNTETEIRRLYDQIQNINSKSVKNRNYLHQRFLRHHNNSPKSQNVEIDGASSSLLSAAVVQAYNNYQLQQHENNQMYQLQNQQQQQQLQHWAQEEADVSSSESFTAKTQRLSEYLLQKRNLETPNSDQLQNRHSSHKRHINVNFFN